MDSSYFVKVFMFKMKSKSPHEESLQLASSRFKAQVLADLAHGGFNWHRLISLILEEDSPLQEVFTSKTLHLAALFDAATKVQQFASELEDMDEMDQAPPAPPLERTDEEEDKKIN